MPRLKAKPEQAKQLLEMIKEMGLVEEIEADIYRRWRRGNSTDWIRVQAELDVLETAQKLLSRMKGI